MRVAGSVFWMTEYPWLHKQKVRCRTRVRHLTSDFCFLQLPQHLKQLFVVRLIGNVVNVYVRELAFLVDDKYRALGNTIVGTVRAKGFGYFALGMKVAEKI